MPPSILNILERPFPENERAEDRAMSVRMIQGINGQPEVNQTLKGGIDLNAINQKLQSEGQGVNIKFDPAMIEQFKRGNFTGVQIRILEVTPVQSLRPLLGLREEDEHLAKV